MALGVAPKCGYKLMTRTKSESSHVVLSRKLEITLDKKQLQKLHPGKTLPKASDTVDGHANIGRCKREEPVKVFLRWEGEMEESEGKGGKGEKRYQNSKGKEKEGAKEEKGSWCVFEWRPKGYRSRSGQALEDPEGLQGLVLQGGLPVPPGRRAPWTRRPRPRGG